MSTHESKRKQSPKSEGHGKPARSPNLITWLAMASCALALTACGGGEASADAPQGS